MLRKFLNLKNRYFYLLLILLVAIVLRFCDLSNIPVSLYWDEAAQGYNAYSILKTGSDEYGNFLPILFRSFDDYKLPANIYLTTIPVFIFGLNEFSTRFISAFLGTSTVLLVYFLVSEFLSFEANISSGRKKTVALTAAFLLAFSPWHLQFSRGAFEANVGLFFVVLSAWLFLRGLKRNIYLVFSFLCFALSFYTYRSLHVFVPLLLLGLVFSFRKELLRQKKWFAVSLVLFCITLSPLLPQLFTSGGLTRANQVSILNNVDFQNTMFDGAKQIEKSGNDVLSRIFYNRRLIFISQLVKNYVPNFSLDFLFVHGDANPRHGTLGMGLLYLWELPFLLIGLFYVFSLTPRVRNLILWWALIAAIPSALSIPSPHALRSLNMLPSLYFIVSLGIVSVFYIVSKSQRVIFGIVLGVIVVFFFVRYINLYYIISSNTRSSAWADGYKQLAEYVFLNESKYEKVVISGHYWKPYIYMVLYKKYDPKLYQRSGSSWGYDKYIFGGTGWGGEMELKDVDLGKIANSKKVLVALSPEEYEGQKGKIHKITEINNHNNELMFIVGEL